MLRALWNRLVDRLHRDARDAELAEELRFHSAMLQRDGEAEPHRRLGNTTRIREESREHWSLGALDHFGRDVRYALRGLIKAPLFSVAVIATLGLGIGANIAMLSITDRLMFRPFAFMKDPASVNRVYLTYDDRNQSIISADGIVYTRYLDLQRWTITLSDFAVFAMDEEGVGNGNATLQRQVAVVSGSFFSFFNMRPAAGRFFGPDDDRLPTGSAVAVLGYRYWKSVFGGQNVLGQMLQVGSVRATIIGVAPDHFAGVNELAPDVLIPATLYAGNSSISPGFATNYYWGWTSILVRRKPGVTTAQASADLSQAYQKSWLAERAMESSTPPLEVAHPRAIAGSIRIGAGPDPSLEARTARWVLGVAAMVLLIACANVINLYLVRGIRRRRETAVRIALGVSGRRIALLAFIESMTLAVAGGVVGLTLAQFTTVLIQRFFVSSGDPLVLFTDGRAILATAVVTLVVGGLTTLIPLILAGQVDIARALRSGVRSGSAGRTRVSNALLVLQGTLSVLLLVGAGLFVRSVHEVSTMRLGYDADRIVLAIVNRRTPGMSDSARVAMGRRVVERGAALPGVQHVAWVGSIPFYTTSSMRLFVTGIDSVDRLGHFTYEATTPDYFAMAGTRIVRGRGLQSTDVRGAPRVTVVSEAMGEKLWPGRDPIGQCLRIQADTMPCTMVVGIAENALQQSLTDEVPLRYYLPLDQDKPTKGFALMLRTSAPPATQLASIRAALQPLMEGDDYIETKTLESVIGDEMQSWHFGATMFTAFGVLALFVAAIGLYALVSYGVTQRSHELSVRVALGARSGTIIGMVVGQGLRFALLGVAGGVALALAAGRWVQPLLFHESAHDPAVFGAVACTLLVVALCAAFVPALRASRADPNAALRAD